MLKKIMEMKEKGYFNKLYLLDFFIGFVLIIVGFIYSNNWLVLLGILSFVFAIINPTGRMIKYIDKKKGKIKE